MHLGFIRRVEELYIDMIDATEDKEVDVSGNYTCVIVPKELKGRKVIIIPIDEDEKPLTLEKMLEKAKIK